MIGDKKEIGVTSSIVAEWNITRLEEDIDTSDSKSYEDKSDTNHDRYKVHALKKKPCKTN